MWQDPKLHEAPPAIPRSGMGNRRVFRPWVFPTQGSSRCGAWQAQGVDNDARERTGTRCVALPRSRPAHRESRLGGEGVGGRWAPGVGKSFRLGPRPRVIAAERRVPF